MGTTIFCGNSVRGMFISGTLIRGNWKISFRSKRAPLDGERGSGGLPPG